MRRRTRQIVGFALALALVTLVAGPAVGQEGDQTLRVAIKGFENNITPFTVAFGANPATNDLQHLVYDSLFWSQAKADPEPWLAESAVSSDDDRVWTVTVREGITWHDGEPFTVEDVAFTFDYYKQQAGASGRYAHHVFDVPAYERSEIVDDRTIRLFFSDPAPQFKIMPGADLPIIAEHVFGGVTEPGTMTTDLPVGTGPFRVVDIQPDQRYRLEANKDYFKGEVKVDQLELVIIKDPASAFTALRTGDVDMVERNVPPELVDQLRGEDGIVLAEGTRLESSQLSFNARKPPFDDALVRKGISLGIDLDAVVDTVLLGNGRAGRDTYLHPDSPWAVDDADHEFDPEAAAAMLDEAGFATVGSDGVRTGPEGERLELNVLVSSFDPLEIRTTQLIASQLEPLGVKLNVEPLDPATLRQRRQAAPGEIPGFDAYVSNIESHAHVDPDALYYFFHSPGPRGFGGAITGYTNTDYDAIVEEAAVASNDDRRVLLADAQEVLARDIPMQVLWYPDGIWAFREDAYDGWIADPGHGIFTKRSFLPGYEDLAVEGAPSAEGGDDGTEDGGDAEDETEEDADAGSEVDDEELSAEPIADDGSSATPWLLAGAAVIVVGAGAVFASRRRNAVEDE